MNKKKIWLLIVGLLLLDQVVKIWIKTHFLLDESVTVFPNWFFIRFIENPGAAFGFELSIFERYSSILRTVGRVAAPLFLFVLVQSIWHTRSRRKLLLRLYIAAMCVGLFDTAINFFFGEILGYRTPGNIIFTFFYVAFYSSLLEWMIISYKNKKIRSLVSEIFIFVLSFISSCDVN